MIRHAAAVGIVVCLSQSGLWAQSTSQSVPQSTLRVSVASANVHKAPSTGSPVIGTATRGVVLPVARELGSWVKISWPAAEDGVGYVHVSAGSVSGGPAPARSTSSGFTPTRPAPRTASPATDMNTDQFVANDRPTASMRTTYVSPPSHIVGFGGRMSGTTVGFGVTGRAWTRDRFGLQVDFSRAALTSAVAPGRVTSVQFAPSLIYSLPDRVSDYVWMRPYLGAGGNLHRQTWRSGPEAIDSVSDNSLGFRAFGGGEFTFASVPRFAVSADLGYDWSSVPFTGFDFGGLGFSVSGHWYVK
jgi:hypothetical protein